MAIAARCNPPQLLFVFLPPLLLTLLVGSTSVRMKASSLSIPFVLHRIRRSLLGAICELWLSLLVTIMLLLESPNPPQARKLKRLIEGKPMHAGTPKRSLLRPKSLVPSASAFESVEGSDEDDIIETSKLDLTYLHTNGNDGPEGKNPYEILPDNANASGEKVPIAASSMIRSHSVSGDLHGVQPDPITADILRKEPEKETFA